MKRISSLLSLVAVLSSAIGCHREPVSPRTSEDLEKITKIYAVNGDASTKTVLGEDGQSVLWRSSERISVFFNDDDCEFVSGNEEPEDRAVFFWNGINKDLLLRTNRYIYAVCPYSYNGECRNELKDDKLCLHLMSSQVAVEGSYCSEAFPCVGRSEDVNIKFYNVCGGVCFSVSKPGVRRVSFRGNNDETLAGDPTVVFDDNGLPVVVGIDYAINTITLSSDSNEGFKVGSKYYISILPVELTKGFTMCFQTANSKAELRHTGEVTVKRSIFGNLGIADSGLEYIDVKPSFVDLGLSVKWSEFNLGALSKEECGLYFHHGDTVGLSYDVINPDWETPYAEMDANDNLLMKYDAAQVQWGNDWRIPSKEDALELLENCDMTYTYNYEGTGVEGYICTSLIPGYTDKSIFIPGYSQWSRTFVPGMFDCAYMLYDDYLYYRYNTVNIRPVCGDKVELRKEEGIIAGSTLQLFANAFSAGKPGGKLSWSSSDVSVASVSDNGLVSALKAGDCTVTASLGNGVKAECKITVLPDLTSPVDLGLSVKWSGCNLGAKSPMENGLYFKFGDTVGQYWTGTSWSGKGFTENVPYLLDENNNLKPEYDAAYVLLGGSWRIPTADEIQELLDNTEATWIRVNGKEGKLFKGTKAGYTDKYIFLPAAGYVSQWSDIVEQERLNVIMHSATEKYSLLCSSVSARLSQSFANDGPTIRPVCN